MTTIPADLSFYYISALVVGGIAGVTLTNTIFKSPKINRTKWWRDFKSTYSHPDMGEQIRNILKDYEIPFFLKKSEGFVTGIELIEIITISLYVFAEVFLFIAFIRATENSLFLVFLGYVSLLSAIILTTITYVIALYKTCNPYALPVITKKSQLEELIRLFALTNGIA